MNVDLKDRKILYELDINSRQSYAQIGRKVGLPKTVVFHRINSLIKRGILKNSYSVINFAKLGYTQYKIYLKFHSINLQKEKSIIDYLIKKEKIVWVTSCRGKWDLAITTISKDIVEFDEIFKDLINKFGKIILDKEIYIVSYSPLYSRNYLVGNKEKEKFLYIEKIEDRKLDSYEERIIKLLANNSRISILDIMDKLDFTRDFVGYRIKKLKKEGIILGYRSLIELNKLGYSFYKVIFRLKDFSKGNEKALIFYCESKKNITQYLRLVGNSDLEIEVEIENEEKLYELINELREKFEKIIRDYEVLHIVKEHKLNFYPL